MGLRICLCGLVFMNSYCTTNCDPAIRALVKHGMPAVHALHQRIGTTVYGVGCICTFSPHAVESLAFSLSLLEGNQPVFTDMPSH